MHIYSMYVAGDLMLLDLLVVHVHCLVRIVCAGDPMIT